VCGRCGQPCERRFCSDTCRRRYHQSRYRRSQKGKAVQKRYQESELGKKAQRRYQTSAKGKAAHERYLQRTVPGRVKRLLRERDWILQKLLHDPAYRELIRQRISEEQKRRRKKSAHLERWAA